MSSGVVDVTGFGHVLYEAPDAASAQVINAKATEALGEKSYREANAETRVRPICEHGDWRKIEFVDPRWPEKGWVQVSALLPRGCQKFRVQGGLNISGRLREWLR